MLASIEEKASHYAAHIQGLEGEILKDVKKLKANKQQRNKKFFDRVGFLQKEVESSVQELDRTKRIYFSEESEAMDIQKRAQAADDIARGRKKDMKSFFVSKSKLKKTAGNLSVRQDEVEIRSTGARNDYILSLATANAHQHQYFKFALPVIQIFFKSLKITQNVAFEFLNFGIFHQFLSYLKLNCLVALFDCKLQVFKNSPKWTISYIFN